MSTAPPFRVIGDIGVGFGALAFALDAPHNGTATHSRPGDARAAARRAGGVQLSVRKHPEHIAAIAPPAGWCMTTFSLASVGISTNKSLRKMGPQSVYVMKHADHAARLGAVVLGLQTADAALVAAADEDAIFDPIIGAAIPAYFPCQHAARTSGGILCGVDRVSLTFAVLCPSRDIGLDVASALATTLHAHALTVPILTTALAPLSQP